MSPPYTTKIQPPPGSIVAPNGFPASAHPSSAPSTFLDAMTIRITVFCDEQHCALDYELDEDDPRSWSWVVYFSSTPFKPMSTIRIVPPPHAPHPNGFHDPAEEPYIKLTRVATVAEARGRGLSRKLIDEAFEYLATEPGRVGQGWKGLVLTHAQVNVQGMYEKMGFVLDERLGRWEEEGIEHVGMWKRLRVDG